MDLSSGNGSGDEGSCSSSSEDEAVDPSELAILLMSKEHLRRRRKYKTLLQAEGDSKVVKITSDSFLEFFLK